jgi:hypothetical protein
MFIPTRDSNVHLQHGARLLTLSVAARLLTATLSAAALLTNFSLA